MREPDWITREDVEYIHAEQIREHGGLGGGLREDLLESALARPQNAWSFGVNDIYALAAHLAYGLARNHCFGDGNKRVSFAAMAHFLAMHGYFLIMDEERKYDVWIGLAAGRVEIDDLRDILAEACSHPPPPDLLTLIPQE